jgi:PAS domain S-box-containing protein
MLPALDVRPLILNVEDDDTTRTAVSLILRQEGFDVLEASSGEEALVRMACKPDVVLLDVNLGPGVDGLEVCRKLKADSATARIPLILISSIRVSCDDRVRGLEGGADGYLTKPVDPAELVAHIKAMFRVRQAEQHLQQAQRKSDELLALLDTLLNKAPVGFAFLSHDCRFLRVNDALAAMSGIPAADHLGRTVQEVVPQLWPSLEPIYRQVLAEDRPRLNHQVDGETPAAPGEVRHWLVNYYPVHVHGEPFGVGIIVNDVTERRRPEEQLRQAQKLEAIGQLAGGVAHDFNNLLCIINGYSGILLQSASFNGSEREMLDEIKKAGESSASLTRQLLAFSRRQVLAPRLLDLNAVIGNIEKMLRRVIGEDVELCTELDAGIGAVRADPGQIEQVLMNLAVNARDAMPSGGTLAIQTTEMDARVRPDSPPSRYVVLSVRDTGCGMTAEVKSHIFEPFFTTKGPGKGTGLGLATIYGIVEQSGGRVEVESEPGRGTRFMILLPRAGALRPTPPSQNGVRLPPGGGETILVVEDEDSVRSLTTLVLRQAGYQVLEACDGVSALHTATGHAGVIDLLVTDVVMPGLGGRVVAEKLLQERPELRVLYLSGYTDDAVVREGVLHDRVNFLQKPFSPVALAQKVREVLDAPVAAATDVG